MSDEVTVDTIPDCDFCKHEVSRIGEGTVNKAAYDAASAMGPWAYMCENHFAKYGVGLGTGRGQRLILKEGVVSDG